MSDEMVKRVADALKGFEAARLLETGSVNPSGRDYELGKARAAIDAMREPSEAMLAQARDQVWQFSQDYALIDKDPSGAHPDSAEHAALNIWRAMIDAVLGKVLA